MPVICPTITAENPREYKNQMDVIVPFAHRVQIDLMDGVMTPNKSVIPEEAWWPVGMKADIHLMFKNPLAAVKTLVTHKPNLIIIHAEADGNFEEVYTLCKHKGIKLGVALLPSSQPSAIAKELDKLDYVLIFSGNLGYQGGSHADLSLLNKAEYLKKQKPELEIGWDGGVNDQIISELVFGGIDVLNVGGFIQKAENPEKAYNTLFRIAEETGTT